MMPWSVRPPVLREVIGAPVTATLRRGRRWGTLSVVLHTAAQRHFAQLGADHVAVRVWPRKPPFTLLILRPGTEARVHRGRTVYLSRLGNFIDTERADGTRLRFHRVGPDLVCLLPRAIQIDVRYPRPMQAALRTAQRQAHAEGRL